ncbi:glycosyltransferase [Sphingobacterium sp. SGG-5]|uniref:glycosyltransferase n=1 Tax=Sphingobacterium sp. SGG-5 TaxID=2710881 RepID=UPI0013EC279A|nr:glycosyltransferase [Sphingobacterium sp. SGG-5]NGM63235.1 glycosyltransferase [Sphingobacterium sp. SGG-5]
MSNNSDGIYASGVSVVILTYNTPIRLLENCLASIYNHNDIQAELEIIVVDNNSTNQAAINQAVQEAFPLVKCINNHANEGYGAGNNLGILHAQSECILLINPDAELIEPVFKWAINQFSNEPDLMLLGFRQVDQYKKKTHSFLQRKLSVTSFIQNFFLHKANAFSPKYSVISGACFFLRKSSFLKIGGYDPKIFLYGEERYLHENLLHHFSNTKIRMDLSKKYQHAISDRPFSIETTEKGLTSYFYLQRKMGVPHKKVLKTLIKYYKFLILFYTIKNNKSSVANTNEIIKLLKTKF